MSIADTSVHTFFSTMSGAPAMSGTAGTLISVLDACLVNGFGSVTLNSLVVASNVATATVNTGHGISMIGGSGGVGPVIRIAGATPSGLNGDWRIAGVTNSTTFTFVTADLSDQTATGTITAKIAPADWTKPYSGTNKAAYARPVAAEATAMLLRVDNTPAQIPTLLMYEAMSDIDTGSGVTPTGYVLVSASGDATARGWRLFADELAFYLVIDGNPGWASWNSAMFFGDIINYRAGDEYHCALICGNNTVYNAAQLGSLGTASGAYFSRSYTQTGGAVGCSRYSYNPAGGSFGEYGTAYPDPVDGAYHASCVEAGESTTSIRGRMPGMWNPLHSHLFLADGLLVPGVDLGDGAPRAIFHPKIYPYRPAFDLTGPWR